MYFALLSRTLVYKELMLLTTKLQWYVALGSIYFKASFWGFNTFIWNINKSIAKKSEYQLLSDKKISLCQLLVIRDQLNSTNVTESLHSTRRPKIYCVTNRGISHLLPLVKLSLVDLFQYVAETVCFSSLSVCIILKFFSTG